MMKKTDMFACGAHAEGTGAPESAASLLERVAELDADRKALMKVIAMVQHLHDAAMAVGPEGDGEDRVSAVMDGLFDALREVPAHIMEQAGK